MRREWLLLGLLPCAIAWPNPLATRGDNKFEWTALGDSYASGVGSTNYVDGRRCLRYDQAWPVLLNGDDKLGTGSYIFNNVVCSGSHYSDIEDYQFYDEDKTNQPNWQYSPRPKFGDPQMATLAVGGDDIDFPGIIFNCILETHFWGGPAYKTCSDQRKHSWSLINSPDLVNNINHLIDKTIVKGRKGSIGDKFLLYVTGYAEFFNEVDPACNDVTFARAANPNNDGKEHTKMTIEIRKDFNQMSLALNAAIEDAVNRNKDRGVEFIDIQADGALDGHRFCEKGIKEPDQNNDKLFFWHYPYDKPKDDAVKFLADASNKVTSGLSPADLTARFQSGTDYTNAIFDALGEQGFKNANGGDIDSKFGWDSIGWRAKVFHPQVKFHQHIKDLVFAQYEKDTANSTPPPPPAPKTDENNCHGVSGDYWVMHRDTAADNVNDFCGQGSKSVEYNQNSVDHLRLSVEFRGDESKGPRDSPDCKGHFIAGVIDGCDGSDSLNNPHNYKFGSTLTTADGWVFKMEPLSQQVNKDNCEVTYKFVFDGFEIRGKDWPDAKLGANGEGLKKQIEGCGVLTNWGFDWTPKDGKYQWYAHGQLPVGTKSCVGSAVQSAGGSSRGNCNGAGKL